MLALLRKATGTDIEWSHPRMKTSVADGTAVGTDWAAQVLQITDDVTICGVCPLGFGLALVISLLP